MTVHHTGWEIAMRLIQVVLTIAGILNWLFVIWWANCLYDLWTIEKSGDDLISGLQFYLMEGRFAIALFVIVGQILTAIRWAIYVPIAARALDINGRDPKIARVWKDVLIAQYVGLAISIPTLIVVPLLVAHFRFGYFG